MTSCLLYPLRRDQLVRDGGTEAAIYVLRVTINGTTENLNMPSLTADRDYWMSGDNVADSSAGTGDLFLRYLITGIGTHTQFGFGVSAQALTGNNYIEIQHSANIGIQWSHASTTLNAAVFGFDQSSDVAPAAIIDAPGQTRGVFAPCTTPGIVAPGHQHSFDSRPIANRIVRGASSMAGVQRIAYLGAAAQTRSLKWDLLREDFALNEYVSTSAPTCPAEASYEALTLGRYVRFYADRSSRTTTSFSSWYLRIDDSQKVDSRETLIYRDSRFPLRWVFELPLRSTEVPA